MFNRSYNHKDVLTRASMTIQLIDDIVLYKAQLFSTNGNILSSSEQDTTVSVVVFKGTENITQRFTDIVWSRFSADNGLYQEDLKWGEQHKGKTTINVTRNDINEKANIQVAVYEIINGERSLVASDFISFVDINDIKGSNTPPSNPKDGDLWLNTNSFPPKLMVWSSQLGEWAEMIVAGEERRNWLRNSNFYGSNFKYWTNIGSPITSIEQMSGKKWARIRSNAATNSYCGISQTIEAKSSTKYAFQMLSKVYAHAANPNGKAVVAFYSINDNNQKTLIQEKNINITLDVATHTTTFTSLTNTKKIEVVVSGQKQATFDFVTTNLKLEANSAPTTWEIAIEDIEDALNEKVNNSPEEIFNSLTDGGKRQGIYIDTDSNGNKHYYFSGQYINAKNLTVSRNDGKETFKIDGNGNVTIKGNIQIQGFDGGFKEAASVEDITYTVVLTNENHSIMCNASGTPISGQIGSSGKAKTKVLAYKGNRLLQAVDTTSQLADGKFCVNIKSTDGTGTLRRVSGSYDEYYIDGTISDNGYFDLEIIFEKTSNAKAIKRFTYAKIKPGATGPQGPQGVPGPQGLQGLPGTSGTDGKTTYFHIKYSAVANPTSSSQMTDTPNTYIGTYVDYTATSSTDPKKYTWARLQGAQGSKGDQGVPGINGTDGKTTYLHIKYSNDGGKTFTGNNGEDVGTWIGQYTDFNLNDSTSVSSYKWSKIQGPQGPQGSQGPQGEALNIYDGTFSEGTKFWSLSYANYTEPNTNTQTKTANTSIYGGKTLKVTNDTWLYSKNPIPIEEGRIYKFVFRVRQLQNPINDGSRNRVYAGATEFAHDGTRLSVNNGTYFVISGTSLPVQWNSINGDSAPESYNAAKDDQYIWTEYTKYMSTSAKAAVTYDNVVKFPAVAAFTSRTKYIKPMFIVNYSGGNGIAEVDSLIVKDVTAEYEAAKESAHKLNNNAQAVWDKMTQEGKIQGLFVAQNGKVYINGEYVNAKNLRVQDKNNNLTLGIDDNGNVTIRATSLSIGTKSVASKDDVNTTINNMQIGGRNIIKDSGTPKSIVGTGTTNKTGCHYQFTVPYLTDIKGKELIVAFDWKYEGENPSGVFYMQTGEPQYATVVGTQTISTTNTSGTITKIWKPTAVKDTKNVYIRTDNMVGTFTMSNLRIYFGTKDIGWTPAPEDTQAQLNENKNNLAGKVDKNKIISSINLTEESVKINADKIKLTGDVIVDAINGGSTTISGDKITTGTITADKITIRPAANNLLKNGAFLYSTVANPPEFWDAWGACSRTLNTITGKKWLNIYKSDTQQFRGISQITDTGSYSTNTSYTISMLAMPYNASYANKGVKIGVHLLDSSNNILEQYWNEERQCSVGDSSTTPRLVKFTFKTGSNPNGVKFNVMIGGCEGSNFDYRITDISMVKGDYAMQWTPHISEVYSQKVNITDNGISIKNNAGVQVMSADSSGNLRLTGDFAIGTTGGSDRAYHSATYSRWNHIDGSYTQLSSNGLQKFVAGSGKHYHYLMETGKVRLGGDNPSSYSPSIQIQLPEAFNSKKFSVILSVGMHGYFNSPDGTVADFGGFSADYSISGYNPAKITIYGRSHYTTSRGYGFSGYVDVYYMVIA